MKRHLPLCFLVSALGLISLFPLPVLGDTIYTLTGKPYTELSKIAPNTYPNLPNYYALSGEFRTTMTGTQLENLSDFTIPAASIVSFSFTDGSALSITQQNETSAQFSVSTNPTGAITAWGIELYGDGTEPGMVYKVVSCYEDEPVCSSNDIFDFSGVGTINNGFWSATYGSGQQIGNPDTWTVMDTPEPSTLILLGFGLLILAWFNHRRKVHRAA